LWMRKQGYRHPTVKYCIQALKSVARHANLLQPESAKAYLASAEMSESRKAKLTLSLRLLSTSEMGIRSIEARVLKQSRSESSSHTLDRGLGV
jgi:hypothetical protein